MNESTSDEVMTVKEVADYLRLAESTVYRLVKLGSLPGRKLGGTWRFSRKGLEAWLNNQVSQVVQKESSQFLQPKIY